MQSQTERYLALAQLGRNRWWRYVLGALVILFFWLVLGYVPYLGLLFSKKETVKEKTELIFFITVHIVTPNKAIKDLPNVAKAYLPSFTLYEEKDVSKRRRLKKKID